LFAVSECSLHLLMTNKLDLITPLAMGGSQSITCQPAEVIIPVLTVAEANTRFIDPEGQKAELA
jgi:hypothetical protein